MGKGGDINEEKGGSSALKLRAFFQKMKTDSTYFVIVMKPLITQIHTIQPFNTVVIPLEAKCALRLCCNEALIGGREGSVSLHPAG